MEADPLKNEDCVSRWVAEGSLGWALPSPSKTDRKVGSSLGLGWANSMNESFCGQFTSLHTSANVMLGGDVALPGDAVHSQTFQETKPLHDLASPSLLPHVLQPNHTGIFPACPNHESLGIPQVSTATSPPLKSQEAIFCQNREQNPGQQEQLMIRQMEHLQRLVTEQQKIIAFYNPGFSVPPGSSPHLLATMPPLPRVPAALFPAQLPLKNTLPVQDSGVSPVTPLLMEHTLQQCATGTSANGSCSEASRKHPESQAIEPCLETLPAIKEEKGEQEIDEHTSLSPFGVRINSSTTNVDDRSMRPGIGARQKTFEELTEEKLKVHSQRTGKQQKNSCDTDVAARTSFLKSGEGTRLEKNKENLLRKEQTNLLRRVSFDCQNHFAWPAHCDTEKLLGKHAQLKRQGSSPMMLFMDGKIANCITPTDINCQHNRLEQRPGETNESSNTGGHDGEETVNKEEPDVRSQINCTECHKQINVTKAKVFDETDMSCPGSQDHSDGDNDRSIDTKIPVWHKENLEVGVSQVTGWSIDASLNTSKLQNFKENKTNLANQNSRLQVTQAVNDKRSEIKVESGPGFKKVNDQIVKVVSKSNRKQAATIANSQRKQHLSAGAADRWKRSPPSSDSDFTSTDSEDEPKSHCSQYPVRPGTHRATNRDHSLDLSDADYATDEPSGPEDGKHPAKKVEVQELAGQQETSLITSSSSESSTGIGSLKDTTTHSPLRKSPFRPSKTAKDGREPETWWESSASHSMECRLQPRSLTRDLVASLFPVFKTKASAEDEKAALEEVKKRPTDKLEEWETDIKVQHRETSLLAQMKEEQAKAMAFLRRQINQLETNQLQELHHLEEGKSEEAVEPQKENEGFKKHIVKEEEESAEIKMLRQQISGLQEEIRRNESRWHAAHGELRSQVEALTKQNLELQVDLRVSEHRRMEAKRSHGPVDFIERGAEVPVLKAVLGGASPHNSLEERPSRGNHRSRISMHATRSSLQRSESLKSATGAHREKSPPKSLHSGNVSPTGRRILHQPPFENSSPKSILSRKPPLYVESKKDEDVKEKIEYPDGKVEQLFADGRRIMTFRNGTKKEISADKRTTLLTFFNGDIKKTLPDQRVIYYYADAQTTHITYPNGMEILQFPNHQIEKHHPDGTKEIVFPDQTIKRLYDGGIEETVFPDGTVVKVEKNGAKTILFSNGQKEIQTAEFKRREYTDGTIKTVYANGRQETKYSSGRVRIKDSRRGGGLILDQK
uniref:centromere protein J-like n=1 Tax=Euleptes europaea TaxID=460621 RepID=UPI00254241DD|nr:centromere protein J-like [Euleptes europaea]